MPFPFDDDHAPLYSVGQVAGMLDVQPAYLRRLDVECVVQPDRSEGGQRRYSRNDITLLAHVTTMTEGGMTLPAIRRILELEAEVRDLQAKIARLETKGARRAAKG